MSDDLSGFSMLELFRMEAESQTTTLSVGLVALEGALATPESIEPLMRAAHSLKGAARIVGLDAAVRIAHAMEDCFVAAQKGRLVLQPEHVDVLFRGVDMLVQISHTNAEDTDGWQCSHAAEIDALVIDLTSVQQNQLPDSVAPLLSQQARSEYFGSPWHHRGKVRTGKCCERGSRRKSRNRSNRFRANIRRFSRKPPDRKRHNREEITRERTGVEPAVRDGDRVVRVSAESLTRLMGLAGEALVQTHRLRPLVDSLWRLEGRQTGLLEILQVLEDRLSSKGAMLPAALRELLNKAKDQAAQRFAGAAPDGRINRRIHARQRGCVEPSASRSTEQPDEATGRRNPELSALGP